MKHLHKMGYAYEYPLTKGHTLDTFRTWLRENNVMGEPSNNPSEYPEKVYFQTKRDEAACWGEGCEMFQVFFKYPEDAELFEKAFG